MEPITVGCITLTAVDYQPIDDGEEDCDSFPEFECTGTVEVDGIKLVFSRSVSLELDGRDAQERHIAGFDWDADDTPLKIDRGQIGEDLYNAIYSSKAYQAAARAFHGPSAAS